MSDELEIDSAGPLAVIAFRRPRARNALTIEMLRGITRAIDEFATRQDLRAILIRGADDLPFSAGYDMDELPSGPLMPEDARAIHAPVRAAASAIANCPHPVVAAARVHVFGAALDLFAHCDLRLAEEGTRFCMPPNRHGFLYPHEGLQRLAAVAGLSAASDMLLTAEPIDAVRAQANGLVQRVLSQSAFETELSAFCGRVIANAPLSMRATKSALAAIAHHEPATDNYALIAQCLNSTDVAEGRNAFRDKRQPRFRGE